MASLQKISAVAFEKKEPANETTAISSSLSYSKIFFKINQQTTDCNASMKANTVLARLYIIFPFVIK